MVFPNESTTILKIQSSRSFAHGYSTPSGSISMNMNVKSLVSLSHYLQGHSSSESISDYSTLSPQHYSSISSTSLPHQERNSTLSYSSNIMSTRNVSTCISSSNCISATKFTKSMLVSLSKSQSENSFMFSHTSQYHSISTNMNTVGRTSTENSFVPTPTLIIKSTIESSLLAKFSTSSNDIISISRSSLVHGTQSVTQTVAVFSNVSSLEEKASNTKTNSLTSVSLHSNIHAATSRIVASSSVIAVHTTKAPGGTTGTLKGWKIGVIAACAIIFLLILLLVFYCKRRRKKVRRFRLYDDHIQIPGFTEYGGTVHLSDLTSDNYEELDADTIPQIGSLSVYEDQDPQMNTRGFNKLRFHDYENLT